MRRRLVCPGSRREWYLIFIGGTILDALIASEVAGYFPGFERVTFWGIMSLSNAAFYLQYLKWKKCKLKAGKVEALNTPSTYK